jgi:hypothetical protein
MRVVEVLQLLLPSDLLVCLPWWDTGGHELARRGQTYEESDIKSSHFIILSRQIPDKLNSLSDSTQRLMSEVIWH